MFLVTRTHEKTYETVTRESSSQDSEEEDSIPDQETLFTSLTLVQSDTHDLWDPPDQIFAFLTKNFKKEAMFQEYPKPNCPAMEVPRLDNNVKEQLKPKGMDPKSGAEKNMF